MAEERKMVELVLDDAYIDRIIEQLNAIKSDKNKVLKLANEQKSLVLVISHKDNELRKKAHAKRQAQ